MAGGKGKSSGGKSSGGKTSVDGPKKQQSHSARAGLQVSRVVDERHMFLFSCFAFCTIPRALVFAHESISSLPSKKAIAATRLPGDPRHALGPPHQLQTSPHRVQTCAPCFLPCALRRLDAITRRRVFAQHRPRNPRPPPLGNVVARRGLFSAHQPSLRRPLADPYAFSSHAAVSSVS